MMAAQREFSDRRMQYEGGDGLGLSIAKKIIDCHQGSIHIESTFAKGTKVVMQFVTV